jgi:hypothetical protein
MSSQLLAGDLADWNPASPRQSMAKDIEDQLAAIIPLPAGEPATSARRKAFIAIARGVIAHLKRNASALTVPASVLTVQPTGGLLALVSFTPDTISGGGTVTGTVTLNAPAPAGGVTVQLFGSNPQVATVPSTVTVLQGATVQDFSVTTASVSATSRVVITARVAGVTLAAATPVAVAVNADVVP